MIYNKDNRFGESTLAHSLALRNDITTPAPGYDTNPLMMLQKKNWGAGMYGLGGLSFDGTGLLGTGLFSGDISTWGISELVFGLIGAYAVYAMFFQVKQTKYRMEGSARRRRVGRAKRLRDKAKRLEEKTEGIF